MVIILKFSIIFSSNLCFMNEIQCDNGACPRGHRAPAPLPYMSSATFSPRLGARGPVKGQQVRPCPVPGAAPRHPEGPLFPLSITVSPHDLAEENTAAGGERNRRGNARLVPCFENRGSRGYTWHGVLRMTWPVLVLARNCYLAALLTQAAAV